MACVFAFTALRLAMLTARIASTTPDCAFGIAWASPASTTRAAFSASVGSLLPRNLRRDRSERLISSTCTPRSRICRASPAPYVPVPSTPARASRPNEPAHSINCSYPIAVVGTECVATTRPTTSINTATCTSRCVSTPRITSRSSMGRLMLCSWMRGNPLPTPVAGQDTHDANKQSSYQVTDDGPGNRGERRTPVDRSMQRQRANPSTSQTGPDVHSNLRLSVPTITLATHALPDAIAVDDFAVTSGGVC